MAKLKDFFRSKSGKITISIIAAIVVAASIGAIITIKHKKIDNNKIAETKKEQTLDTEKRDEAIKEAEAEEKSAEKELEKAKYSGNKEEIEKAKAKVSKAREKAEKVQNKTKGTKSTNSSSNERNSANKPPKPSNGGSNKPNKPSKQKETLAQEIARIKQEIRSGYSVPVKFMDRLITKTEYYNDSIVNIVDEWADRQGISGFGYSTRQLSNGKFLVYLHHFTYKK